MIRARASKIVKVKTPGNRVVIHYEKRTGGSFSNLRPKIKREMLKQRARA